MKDSYTSLTDLLGVAHLQLLQDNFSNLAGVSALLVDPDGQPFTRPSLKEELLHLLVQTNDGMKQALQVCKKLCVANRKKQKSMILPDQNSLFQVGAIPIFLEGRHLGSWIVMQLETGDLGSEQWYERVELLGLSKEQAAAALPKTASLQAVETFIPFLEALTHTVIQLAQVNYDMMKSNESLVELTEQLDSTAQMLSKFTNSADVGMYVTDFFTGEILQANERFARFVNLPVEKLIGSRCWKWFDEALESFCPNCPHDKLLDEKGHPGNPVIWERYLPSLNIWGQFTNQAIYWVDGRLAHMVTFADITQTKQMQEQLANLAYYDRVMRLPNSLKLLSDLQNWSVDEEYHLICFDIVMLRTINDVYSRQTGDMLLMEIARWVQRLKIAGAQLYRVDGDEFVLLVKNQSRAHVQKTAEIIRNRFEEPWIFTINEERIHIFCSVTTGVVHIDDPEGTDSEELLSLMERTLATARETGRTAVYDEAMDEAYKEHLKLELSLRRCVKEGMLGFQVFYQPIVDPVAGTWCSLEALCRWTSPECGEVPPLIFIHEAEQMGLIGALGRWVLETAISQCKQWGLDQLDYFLLDVNLSPAQMTDETLVTNVIEILNRYDYPGDKLSLEITESTQMNFSQHTLNAIERLRRVNVQVALDDFGTGYSSFNNLKQMPVSILKTERAFLENIENDTYLQYLNHVMVELAHAADMKIIAEGVENEEQMRILLKNGVDYLQGYLFSRPLPPSELQKQLENFKKVAGIFYRIQDDRIDVQKLLDGGYTITPTLYRLLNQCMQILLSPINTGEAIYQALKLVGTKFNISRSSIYWRDANGNFSKLHEWKSEDAQFLKSSISTIQNDKFEKTWIPLLREKGLILAMDVQQLPSDISDGLVQLGSKAVALMPIWKEDTLQGLVGFDDCKNYRDWLPEEILMLHNLSLLMANMLERQTLQNSLLQQNQIMDNVLNSMDMLIFLSDDESKQILFANDKMRESFGAVEGQECWRFLPEENGPCSICKEGATGIADSREQYSRTTKRFYRIYDKVIPWKGNRSAHLEYAIDITTAREYEEQLRQCSELDTFTQTLNRTALLKHVSHTLECGQGKDAAICFVDINKLKYTNETYGHQQGDAMVLATVEALRSIMNDGDIIGRYGGDEFILLLPVCTREKSAERMETALAELYRKGAESPVPYTFSYGVAMASEVSQDKGEFLQKLFEIVEQRMVSQKRADKEKSTPAMV